MAAFSRRLFLWWMGGLGAGAVVGVAEAAPKRNRYSDIYSNTY